MKINVTTENCDTNSHYLIKESADSKIIITLEIEKIPTVQSKKKAKDIVIQLIQTELKKFKWIISGSVSVDFIWYLNRVEKQETDKIGDIDNISKPIIDSLIGPDGILIDDSQIKGLYSSWISRNQMMIDNILRIEIRFNNDYCFSKMNLKFIQYDKAICVPVNLDLDNIESILLAKATIRLKNFNRKTSTMFKALGANVDSYILVSEWDYHRSRLNAFNTSDILTLKKFNSLCKDKGINMNKKPTDR